MQLCWASLANIWKADHPDSFYSDRMKSQNLRLAFYKCWCTLYELLRDLFQKSQNLDQKLKRKGIKDINKEIHQSINEAQIPWAWAKWPCPPANKRSRDGSMTKSPNGQLYGVHIWRQRLPTESRKLMCGLWNDCLGPVWATLGLYMWFAYKLRQRQ